MDSKGGRVLVVDDEPEILATLQRQLRREHQVYTAESGSTALKILQTEAIEVIISDQRMPRMTGFELLKFARLTNPNCVQIILSGYADEHDAIVDALEKGYIHRYMSKPWDAEELRSVVGEAVKMSRSRAGNSH